MLGSRAWHAGIHVKSDFENHAGASRLATSYFKEKSDCLAVYRFSDLASAAPNLMKLLSIMGYIQYIVRLSTK